MTYPLNGNVYEVVAATTDTVTLAASANTTGWTYDSGGWMDEAPTAYGTYEVGTILTLYATAAVFDADMVGGLFRLWEDGLAAGMQNAPVGDSTAALADGQVYTNEGNVYGVWNVTGLTNWEKIGRVPAHTANTVRVYAEASTSTFFDADFLHPSYSIVKITGYTSATQVTAEIVRYQMPASIIRLGTVFWEEGAWSNHRGYPSAMTLFEQRLWFGGSDSDPTVVWSSRSGGSYENFADGTKDADAIVYRLSEGSGDRIRWLSGARVLTAGTSRGEYAIAASSQQEALTPTNMRAVVQQTYGTSSAKPVRVNQTVLYPQRSGDAANPARKLREFAYSLSADAYESNNITVFSDHITGAGFDEIAYQPEPDNLIWIRRVDGVLAACTHEKTQEVLAWHRHVIGGGGVVKALATKPGLAGDEVWCSVERVIGGVTKRFIEVIDDGFDVHVDGKDDGVFVDSALVYDGAETATLSGLWHLNGATVRVRGDGARLTDVVVANGRVTLDTAVAKASVGFPIETVIETMDLEGGARAGTAQSRMKRVSQVFVLLVRSLGGKIGTASTDMRPILYRQASDPMDTAPPLYSGHIDFDMPGGHEREAIVRIEHDDPFPFYVAGLASELNTQG